MKIFMTLPLFLIALFISGCSQNIDPYRGSGTDELPKSECSPCKKQIIYRDGQWL